MEGPIKPLAAAVRWSVISLLCFFAAEGAVFRSGLYLRYLQPDSSTGQVENQVYWLRHLAKGLDPDVAIIGDSRVAEGFSATAAGTATGGRLRFWNLGIPGLNQRSWYYVLRDADPDRNRFRALVLALDHYTDDDDAFGELSERMTDLSYLVGRLRLSDCPGFAASYKDWSNREQAFAGCLFRGLTLRPDLREFLAAPRARVRLARLARRDGLTWLNGYTGIDQTMTGIEADFVHKVVKFPPGMSGMAMYSVDLTVMPDRLPYAGATTRYRKWALGRIAARYAGTHTKLIFVQLPRAPLPVPDGSAPEEFVEWISRQPGVEVVPEAVFQNFERPELFGDGLHLNATGRKAFSAALAGVIAGMLEPK